MTKLPKNLSNLKNLTELDLINNPLKDFGHTIECLSSLPKLKNLKINIDKQEEALLVLQLLPNLKNLNDKPTKPSNDFVFDIDDVDVESISLDNELENFQTLFNIIQQYLEENNSSFLTEFSNQFQSLLNKEIETINDFLDGSVPNFVYGNKILNSKLKVFNFFSDVIIKIDKNMSLNGVLIKVIDLKNKAIFDLEEINKKTLTQVFNYQASGKGNDDKSRKISINTKNEIDELQMKLQNKEKDVEYYEGVINTLKEELDQRIKEVNHYKDLESVNIDKIVKLEKENKVISDKLFRYTQDVINNVKNRESREKISRDDLQKENKTFSPNKNLNTQSNSNSLLKNYNNSRSTKNIINSGLVITPPGTKVLTKKMLLDLINEIFQSKTQFDKTTIENKMPKETMEQHMYTYLNYKYGLRNLIIEWAVSIINGIKTFSKEDSQILLFGKILKNEIEEEFRFTFEKLKKTIFELLQVSIFLD